MNWKDVASSRVNWGVGRTGWRVDPGRTSSPASLRWTRIWSTSVTRRFPPPGRQRTEVRHLPAARQSLLTAHSQRFRSRSPPAPVSKLGLRAFLSLWYPLPAEAIRGATWIRRDITVTPPPPSVVRTRSLTSATREVHTYACSFPRGGDFPPPFTQRFGLGRPKSTSPSAAITSSWSFDKGSGSALAFPRCVCRIPRSRLRRLPFGFRHFPSSGVRPMRRVRLLLRFRLSPLANE